MGRVAALNASYRTDQPMLEQPDQGFTVEPDDRFPSGPWKGFFLQARIKGPSWMDLDLTFREGTMRGEGCDWVGQFLIIGRYETESGKCWWTKRYIGKHDVAYHGYNEGKGIWGVWEIPLEARGGFHIWPLAMGDPDTGRLTESLEEPDLVEVTSSRDDYFSRDLEETS